jgi:hypothetical protein
MDRQAWYSRLPTHRRNLEAIVADSVEHLGQARYAAAGCGCRTSAHLSPSYARMLLQLRLNMSKPCELCASLSSQQLQQLLVHGSALPEHGRPLGHGPHWLGDSRHPHHAASCWPAWPTRGSGKGSHLHSTSTKSAGSKRECRGKSRCILSCRVVP